jgi:SAM-dependent methyltransferase
MISRALQSILKNGPRHAATMAYVRMFGTIVTCFPQIRDALAGKRGIEVGGPSAVFGAGHHLPVYPIIGSLDGCNFGTETVWEGAIVAGTTYNYGEGVGTQLISEAWDIAAADGAYDFVLSSHMLEHSANPIRVLKEWNRILTPGGHLLLVLPDGRRTFDHARPLTRIDHLREDFLRGTEESDMTHIEESVALHDLSMTPEYRDDNHLRNEFQDNLRNRRMHHHVFDLDLARQAVTEAGFRVLGTDTASPFHLIVFALKP